MTDRATVCPRCAVGCRLRHDEDDDRATGVDGAPVNTDGRLCPKGITAFEGVDDGRLTEPLVRVDGDLEPASWETALDRVEAGFEGVRDRHGADALAFLGAPRCSNEENYLLQRLARGLGTNNVDNRARICHQSVASTLRDRFGTGAMPNSLDDVGEADAYLVVGADPAAQQPVAFDGVVRPAVNDGATLIQIDPRANRTTRLADVHVAPRPGTDAAVTTALAALIRRDGLVDREFVADRTEGFERYAAALDDVDVAAVADRAGVDVETLVRAARAFGAADRGCVLAGTGAESDDHRGTATADALLDLVLVTGNVGMRGTGLNPLRGLVNEQGAIDAGSRPGYLPGGAPVTDEAARARVAAEWGDAPPADPGLAEPAAVRAAGDSIRGLFVLGENPAVAKMPTSQVARALRDLECLVVQDVSPSETTEYADVVLPASVWAEKAGTVTNLDRQVQRLRPLRSPPGAARRDFDVLRTLGRRLTDLPFDYADPGAAFAELTRVSPTYAGLDYESVGDGGQRWPVPESESEGRAVLHRDRFENGRRRVPFSTPAVPDVDGGEADSAADDGLVLLTRTRVSESKSGADASLRINPADAERRGLGDGDEVIVDAGGSTVRTTASVTDRVRERTVFLDATVADRLHRGGVTRVEVERAADVECPAD